jgi:hypothetical protein
MRGGDYAVVGTLSAGPADENTRMPSQCQLSLICLRGRSGFQNPHVPVERAFGSAAGHPLSALRWHHLMRLTIWL